MSSTSGVRGAGIELKIDSELSNHRMPEEDLTFLPEGLGSRISYLTCFGDDRIRSPFTEEQEAIFLSARKWEKINEWALKIGLAGCTALSMAPGFLGLNKIQDWENSDPKNASTMFIIVTLYAGTIGMINYICTGTLPDKAAMASIKASKEAIKAKATYEAIAYHLLETYNENPAEAKRIASQIDIDKIQASMRNCISSNSAEDICSSLHHAQHAVEHDQILGNAPTSIKAQWTNIQLTKEIQQLRALFAERLGHLRSLD